MYGLGMFQYIDSCLVCVEIIDDVCTNDEQVFLFPTQLSHLFDVFHRFHVSSRSIKHEYVQLRTRILVYFSACFISEANFVIEF
jgi:hypothetical protein